MDWLRLWHDMPTDPKWRTIARVSGQPLACVIALFNLVLVNASSNSNERGTLLGWSDEDAASAVVLKEFQDQPCGYSALKIGQERSLNRRKNSLLTH